jgi:hypothetical protein
MRHWHLTFFKATEPTPTTINVYGSVIENFTIFPVSSYQKLNYSVVASGSSYTLNKSQIYAMLALSPDGFLIESNQNSIDLDTGQSVSFNFYYPIYIENKRSEGNIVVSMLSSLYYSMVKKNIQDISSKINNSFGVNVSQFITGQNDTPPSGLVAETVSRIQVLSTATQSNISNSNFAYVLDSVSETISSGATASTPNQFFSNNATDIVSKIQKKALGLTDNQNIPNPTAVSNLAQNINLISQNQVDQASSGNIISSIVYSSQILQSITTPLTNSISSQEINNTATTLISSILNPASAPSAPTNVTVSLSGKDAIVSFSVPSSDGGSSITNYIIQYSKNNGTTWTDFNRAASTATSNIVVNNLLYYKAYIFRVIAVNSTGNSSPSSSSNSIVTPPGIVGNLYGKFKRGGRPTDSEMLSGNVLSTPLSSPALYSSIDYGENDDEYGFIAIGYFVPPTDGTYAFYTSSDDGSAVWLGDIASASSGRSSSNAVVNNNIIGYQGNTRRGGTISLTANQVYAIRIIHREGEGGDDLRFSWSGPNISERTSLATYFYANNFGSEPPEISTVRVESLDSKIDLYITTVSAPATYYTIYYSSNNGNSYSLFGNGQTSPASPIIVNGLTNGISYKLKIIAVNSTGSSEEYITDNIIPSNSNIRPLSLGQAFLSNIHTDLVIDSEFDNIRIGQTFLSNIHMDPVVENEFENVRIGQTFLSNIYSDPI